eukprot:UC1_evm1s2132
MASRTTAAATGAVVVNMQDIPVPAQPGAMLFTTYKRIVYEMEARSPEQPLGQMLHHMCRRYAVPYETLRGVYATCVKRKLMAKKREHQQHAVEYCDRYLDAATVPGYTPGALLALAEEVNHQPCPFARIVLAELHRRLTALDVAETAGAGTGAEAGARVVARAGHHKHTQQTDSRVAAKEEEKEGRSEKKNGGNADRTHSTNSYSSKSNVSEIVRKGELVGERKEMTTGRAPPAAAAASAAPPHGSRQRRKRNTSEKLAGQWLAAPHSLQMQTERLNLPLSVLRADVVRAIECDDSCGPLGDRLKAATGDEHEYVLMETLRARGVPFITEDAMRAAGMAKTPDVLLLSPIETAGQLVYWIDSKACFGDPHALQLSYKEQFFSYFQNYGPGLAIYWHGFVSDCPLPAVRPTGNSHAYNKNNDGSAIITDNNKINNSSPAPAAAQVQVPLYSTLNERWHADGLLLASRLPSRFTLRSDLPGADAYAKAAARQGKVLGLGGGTLSPSITSPSPTVR